MANGTPAMDIYFSTSAPAANQMRALLESSAVNHPCQPPEDPTPELGSPPFFCLLGPQEPDLAHLAMTHSSPWHPPACCRCRGIGSARALRLGGGRTGLPYFSVFRMNVEVAREGSDGERQDIAGWQKKPQVPWCLWYLWWFGCLRLHGACDRFG